MKPGFISSIVLTLLFVSCSLVGEYSLETGLYEGVYAWGFEVNSFSPCDRMDERWWVRHGSRQTVSTLIEEYRSIADEDYDPVFAKLRGKPGKKGELGHNGSYDRNFEVEEIIELQKSIPNNCK